VNIGNIVASPSYYFDLPNTKLYDLSEDGFRLGKVTIVSKGLLNTDEHLHYVKAAGITKFVIWGHGREQHCVESAVYDYQLPAWLRKCALVGLRDWNTPYRWVPCASCMHTIFDEPIVAPIRHFSAISYHKQLLPACITDHMPSIHNCTYDFRWFIRHIRACEVLITNSYHAAYWATLLQRRVVIIEPHDVKFGRLRFTHPFSSAADWRSQVAKTQLYPDALELCRTANRSFYNDVLPLLKG
jgi:hypothetical protein